jgi:hypothetical protein
MMLSNQTRRVVRSGLVALVSLAALTSRVLGATSTLDVSGPFSGIQSCVSADILVVPGDDYNVQVTGDDKAVAATSASVDSGILQFAVKGPLSTNEAFYITVTMPSDALETIIQSSAGNGDVVVNSGFESKDLKLTADGNGDIQLGVDVTGTLTAGITGNGEVFLDGSIADATIKNSGNGDLSIYDLTGKADLTLSGNGDVYINGASGSSITGTNDGNGDFSYSGATCDVSGNGFGDNCSKVSSTPAKTVAVSGFPASSSIIGGSESC